MLPWVPGPPQSLPCVNLQTDANRLVEEFMLLANTTAANKIADVFPDRWGCSGPGPVHAMLGQSNNDAPSACWGTAHLMRGCTDSL